MAKLWNVGTRKFHVTVGKEPKTLLPGEVVSVDDEIASKLAELYSEDLRLMAEKASEEIKAEEKKPEVAKTKSKRK